MVYIFWFCLAILVGVLGKERKIGFGMAFFWSLLLSPLIGLVITLLSDTKKSDKEIHKYKSYYEKAKKEEFKENYNLAIDNYKEALYHLKNDYKNMNKKLEDSRQDVIRNIEKKLENLESK